MKPSDNVLRERFDLVLGRGEVAVYAMLGILLFVTALTTVASAGRLLWQDLRLGTIAAQTLRVLNELLVVLMIVEIFHTVRISIRAHVLVTEPFLIVGLIASIRRILVISLELAALTRDGSWLSQGEAIFRNSMIELALLGLLVLIFVICITMLRRFAFTPGELRAETGELIETDR